MRRWTAAELDALRACYQTPTTNRLGQLPIKQLAACLGRSYGSCSDKARAMGISRQRPALAEIEVSLRRMHANGESMTHMAKVLRMSDLSVKYALVLLGLDPPKKHAKTRYRRERWLESLRRTLKSRGYESLREVALDKEMGEAMARWPVATTKRQADVLDVLADGPATAAEIAARVGISIFRIRVHIGRLLDLGAIRVAFAGKKGRPSGRGSLPWVYAAFPGLERGR